MKVVVVSSHIHKSLQWYWLARDLGELGWEVVHVHLGEADTPFQRDQESLGLRFTVLPVRGLSGHLRNVLRLRSLLKEERPDVVHTTLPLGNLVGQPAAALAGIGARVTTCENASWAHDFRSRKQWAIDTMTFRLARKVIITNDSGQEYLERNWDFDHAKIVQIPHGLSLEEYESVGEERVERLRRSLGLQPGAPILGMVARMEYWKGHRYAIEAMPAVLQEFPAARLLIVGLGGQEEPALRALVARLGLAEAVSFVGFLEDTTALYRLLDVQVHLPISRYVENFGIAIIEGMVSGCAQVLTLSGVANDTARSGQNCLVVDYQDAAGVARAVLTLLRDPSLGRRLGAQAREDARARFDSRRKARLHAETYLASAG